MREGGRDAVWRGVFFSLRLNVDNVSAVLTSTGRSFHHRGARTESSRERASHHQNIPLELINSLQELINTLSLLIQSAEEAPVSDTVTATVGKLGWPCLEIDTDDLKSLLSTALPLESVAKFCGVSRRKLNRRMKEHGLSVCGCYSEISDDELDRVVRSIKSRMPQQGIDWSKVSC